MHEMKKGIPEAFWEMHNEKFLFRVTICNCQSHHYAYLKLGDQRLCLNWETINSIKTKTALEFGQNISEFWVRRTHQISFCTYICTSWKGKSFAEPANANALSRKGCPSCSCLRQASAPAFCSSLIASTICYVLLQCVTSFYTVLLAFTMCYMLLNCATSFYNMLYASTIHYLLPQQPIRFCSVMIVQNGNWQTLQGSLDSSQSIHHPDSYGYEMHFTLTTELLLSFSTVTNVSCFFCISLLFQIR